MSNVLNYQNFPVYAIMILFFGAFAVATFGNVKAVRRIFTCISCSMSLIFLLLLIKPVMLNGEIIAYWMGSRSVAGGYAIGIALEVDALSLFFGLIVVVAGFVSMLYAWPYMVNDDHVAQYYTLFLMLCGGVLGMVLTGDLFNMYIMVEILTFAAVALTAFRHKAHGALEAAFKYFVVGSIGSTCILVGIVILYAQFRTLNLAQLSALVPENITPVSKLAFAVLFVGFSTKAFIVPFHPLAADAHGAAPAPVSVMISGVLTKSGIYAIIRLVYFIFRVSDETSIQLMLVGLGSVSMFVCVTMALAQHDFKRLLAFHSISQIGYVLTAVGLGTALGISAGLYHAINHTLFKSLLFLAAGAVLQKTGTTDLNKLGGLSRKMPYTATLFIIGAASISGIPPFNGFVSKWMIYQAAYTAAVESGNWVFLIAAIVALITSILTLASFIKVTQSVFFGSMPAEYENVTDVSPLMKVSMTILAVLCIITGLLPDKVIELFTAPAVRAVFSANTYIDTMMGTGYAMATAGEQAEVVMTTTASGVWEPVSWMLLLCIVLLAVTIVAVLGKYDSVSELNGEADDKHALFFGGEKAVFSQVGGDDMFWGFKYNWRHYFSFMHEFHSGVVNDYSLWAAVALALAIVYIQALL